MLASFIAHKASPFNRIMVRLCAALQYLRQVTNWWYSLHKQLEALLKDAHGLKNVGIRTTFDLNTNHGMVGMRLGLDGGSWGHFTSPEEKHGATSDEDSTGSSLRTGKKETMGSNDFKESTRQRTKSINESFDIDRHASVSDFLIFQRRKQEISADDMTDAEIKQKILDLENEVLAYKSALTKRQDADSMFTNFYY